MIEKFRGEKRNLISYQNIQLKKNKSRFYIELCWRKKNIIEYILSYHDLKSILSHYNEIFKKIQWSSKYNLRIYVIDIDLLLFMKLTYLIFFHSLDHQTWLYFHRSCIIPSKIKRFEDIEKWRRMISYHNF